MIVARHTDGRVVLMATEHGLAPLLRSAHGAWGPVSITGEGLAEFQKVEDEEDRLAILKSGAAHVFNLVINKGMGRDPFRDEKKLYSGREFHSMMSNEFSKYLHVVTWRWFIAGLIVGSALTLIGLGWRVRQLERDERALEQDVLSALRIARHQIELCQTATPPTP